MKTGHTILAGVAALLLLIPGAFLEASPAEITKRFESRIYRGRDGFSLPYRLLAPVKPEPGKKYPLVLFLHGSEERGDDNRKQLHVGLHIFASPEKMELHSCFIVAPQCPKGMMWADVDWKSERHAMKEEPTPALRSARELIESLMKELPVDGDRIYITGYSMGGFGAWDAIQRWPGLFAAAAPVCGGGDESVADRIARVPLWAFHGALDNIVDVARTRRMIQSIVRAGGVPRYTEYPEVNHFSWGLAFGDSHFHTWFFSQRRGK